MGVLEKVSVTGADNNVSQKDLLNITKNFPFVEWGILYYPEKDGCPRNPTADWKEDLLSLIPKENTSLHLCGEEVFKQILNEEFETSKLKHNLSKYGRLQLNINSRKLNHHFTNTEIAKIYEKLLSYDFKIIAQYNVISENAINNFINNNNVDYNKFYILLDSSLGRGVSPKEWIVPERFKNDFKLGFAGGLNTQNIFNAYENINLISNNKFWLDLESGIRTNNNFDLEKVKTILNIFSNIFIN